MSQPLSLILDSQNLMIRLVDLAKGDALTPERLDAITARVFQHLTELREHVTDNQLVIEPLPKVSMRFRGPFGVIDGGLTS